MNWIELKALNTLFTQGRVKLNETISKSGEINYLINSLGVVSKNSKEVVVLDGFEEIYEKDYLPQYEQYSQFLLSKDLLKHQIRYEEKDIKILMDLDEQLNSGELIPIRNLIIESEESVRGVSQMFFKNEKYLDNKQGLISALKTVLQIEELANEKDQQYIYKLECHNPKAIVLCENLNFLMRPSRPRKHQIELWYAGGKNVPKLEFSLTRGLPIYYSCDWDYDGLFIIYPLVKEKIPEIKLLYPNGEPKDIQKTEHKSLWSKTIPSGKNHFLPKETELIDKLIAVDSWIIEESNDLIKMLEESENH